MPMPTRVCISSIACRFGKPLVRDTEKATFEANLCLFIEMDIAKKHTKHVKLRERGALGIYQALQYSLYPGRTTLTRILVKPDIPFG